MSNSLINEFLSVSTIYDEKRHSIADIKCIVEKLSNVVNNGEVILLLNNYDYFTKINNIITEELSTHNVQVKVVSTYKYTKKYIFENLAWQAAIGDKLIFSQCFHYLISNFDKIVKYILSSEDKEHICLLEYKCSDESLIQRNRNFVFNEVRQAYNKKRSRLIDKNIHGYIIDRFAINAAFNNQKEQYDPFLSIVTCGLKSDFLSLTKPFSEKKYETSEYYSYSDVLDMLTYYTKFSVFKVLGIISFIILFLSVVLCSTFILINAILPAVFIAIFGNVTSLALLFYPNFIVSRQTFAAANEKNVVGHFEIKKL